MPNPFSTNKHTTGAQVQTVCVSGVFVCEFCFDETYTAEYAVEAKRLVWECPQGHENVVRKMEIEL